MIVFPGNEGRQCAKLALGWLGARLLADELANCALDAVPAQTANELLTLRDAHFDGQRNAPETQEALRAIAKSHHGKLALAILVAAWKQAGKGRAPAWPDPFIALAEKIIE